MARILLLLCSIALTACATDDPSPRIYIFDNGFIRGMSTELFGFTPEELAETDFRMTSYLVVHPRGTLMFDTGGIPDEAFGRDGAGVSQGVMSADRALLPQLAAAGYAPEDIDYFALSHYHSDHTANANAFAGATWIVQRAELDAMESGEAAAFLQPATFDRLLGAEKRVLDNEELDVFGDGTVVVMPAPGHTPGHQVLAVKLANAGTIVLGGDLYHYPEERTTGRIPTFEFDADASRASRARMEAFLEETGGTLWIEHDIATHASLPRAPAFVD
jgi:N-acyl homoserine lactone hydrolase